MTHLAELLSRVRERLATNRNMRWLHLGISAPLTRVAIHQQLALLGLEDRYHESGAVPRSSYFHFLKRSDAWLIADGERNTRISELEAKAWDIPQELPEIMPPRTTPQTFRSATLPEISAAVAA
jgi:hypothetical protein